MNHFYHSGFIHNTVPGALEAYDLPDLAASLVPRKLMMIGITDSMGKAGDSESIEEDISIIKLLIITGKPMDNCILYPERHLKTCMIFLWNG